MKIEYSANNSGGNWWLKDKDWARLENNGWIVEWMRDQKDSLFKSGSDGRWLGALARKAHKDFDTPGEAMHEFEKLTRTDVSDEGCNCCGPPHSFSWNTDDSSWGYASGEDCLQYLFPEKKIPGSLREALER